MSYIAREVEEKAQEALDDIKKNCAFETFKKYKVLKSALVNALHRYKIKQGDLIYDSIHFEIDKEGRIQLNDISIFTDGVITYSKAEKMRKILIKDGFEITHWEYQKKGLIDNDIREMRVVANRWREKEWEQDDLLMKYDLYGLPRGIQMIYTPGAARLVERIADILGIKTEPKTCKKIVE